MTSVVVDASVAIKWFVPEPGQAAARALLGPGMLLCAPDLIIAETCNIAWRKARVGDLLVDDVKAIAAILHRNFHELASSDRLSAIAADIALALDHPVYDAFYVALAELRSVPLITADRRLVARVSGTRWESVVKPLA